MADFPISSTINISASKSGSKTIQTVQPGQFNALLDSADSQASLASDFLGNILNSLNSDISSIFFPQAAMGKFPFSADFQSTFGSSGPLPAWINLVTQKLNLSLAQNQALQNIAVENKDITNTPDNVQKLAQQLKSAGITS